MAARRPKPGVVKKKVQPVKTRKAVGELPVPIVTRDGKTTVRQFPGRRFVRLGEVRGKTLAWVELYTAGPDGHCITLRFQDRTGLILAINPGFTILPEYFNFRTGEYRSLRKWPAIRSEQ
jgi:hypothetical protein